MAKKRLYRPLEQGSNGSKRGRSIPINNILGILFIYIVERFSESVLIPKAIYPKGLDNIYSSV
jgi:hypothetical protein